MTIGIGRLAAVALLLCAAGSLHAKAQLAPEKVQQLRAILGTVNVVEAPMFTANRVTYSRHCGRPFEHEGIATGVSRAQYAVLSSPDQQQYVSVMNGQVQANDHMWSRMANDRARDAACRSLNEQLVEYSANFIRRYPDLFDKRR